MIREHPVFIPSSEGDVASVITIPDGEPRGLVVFMSGVGAHRSHRLGIWTKAARLLAGRGIASVRFDHLGLGESTVDKPVWPLGEPSSTHAALAASRFAMQVTGTSDVVLVGNCYGAWAALQAGATLLECRGVAFIRAPLVLRREGSLRVLPSKRGLARLARRITGRTRHRKRPAAPQAAISLARRFRLPDSRPLVRRVLDRGRILFLFGERESTFNLPVQRALRAMIEDLSPQARARVETKVIPGRTLQGFESIATQEALIGSVVEFATQALAPDEAQLQGESGKATAMEAL